MSKLPVSFYLRSDTVQIARDLLGKFLFTRVQGRVCGGMIVETEAYAGVIDRASHAHGGRRTARNEVMYGKGGHAYVYFCYGIHYLFNVVTDQADIPHAVLVRGLEPTRGVGVMIRRRKKKKLDYTLTSGPGSLCQALGIQSKHNGLSLRGDQVWIEDKGIKIKPGQIQTGSRIGVAYAGEHAKWPYRFWIRGNPWVSKAKSIS